MIYVKVQGKTTPVRLPYGRHPLVRKLKDLEPVLYDQEPCRRMDPELPVYEIHRNACDDVCQGILLEHRVRYDATIMPPLLLGEEHVKTLGHQHAPSEAGPSHAEVFEVLEGEARFLVQKYVGQELVDVSLVTAQENECVLIPPDCGHVMINASSSRLVTGNLISQSCAQRYDQFVQRRGGAYYLLRGGRLVRNQNYPSTPDVRTAKGETVRFVKQNSGLLASFLKKPELFAFLNDPQNRESVFDLN